LLASGGEDRWKQQIELIDQQLAGDLPSEVRAPLAAAQRQLQKAASRAAQPWQAEIAGAVASILEADVALQDEGQVVRHGEGPDTTWHRKVHRRPACMRNRHEPCASGHGL
jgi:hypothetical protein